MEKTAANPAAMLPDELEAAQQLQALLKREQSQLIAASIDTLGDLIQQKAVLIARMAELADKRLKALAQAGHKPEEASMATWFASPAADGINRAAARKTWSELTATIERAKELNRTNGLLIGTHMSRNQAALQVLQGSQDSQVYGRDGQTSSQASRRSLVVG